MDVFKLLTRSAKASHTTPRQTLPSSGEASNPQLFGYTAEQEGQPNLQLGRKRKREEDSVKEAITIPKELDFFGEAFHHKNDGAQVGKNQGSRGANGNSQDGESTQDKYGAGKRMVEGLVERLSEDECKRVLRIHKLKITVLEDFHTEKEKDLIGKKSKKRKKTEEKLQGPPAKKAKSQLYPQPLTAFEQLRSRYAISKRLAENLEAQGYTVPTEVQLGGLPLLLGARDAQVGDQQNGEGNGYGKQGQDLDLLAVAPTGSGKTVTFLVPVLNALIGEIKSSTREMDGATGIGPRAIIIAPTKELAAQIANESRKLTLGTTVKTALMKKGMEVVDRSGEEMTNNHAEDERRNDTSEEDDHSVNELKATGSTRKERRKRKQAEIVKAAILVATPLALLNVLKKHSGETTPLPTVRYLILDEADVLLDPLFRDQTLSIWNACTHPSLRVSLWSATMGSNIEELAISTINNRWHSLVSSYPVPLPPRVPLIRLVVGLKDSAIPNVTHKLVYAATEQGKLLALRQLLHPTSMPSIDTTPTLRPPFLIFTQTIPRAMALHSELLYDIPPEAGGSARIAVLHAGLPSMARDSVMTRFRRGEVWVLITTDLLARGVDFRGLNGVVNYDVPNSAAAYVHRVGRTGRAGREGGVAVTLYTTEDIPYIKNVANVIRASEKLQGKAEGDAKKWLLDALPTPSKRDRQKLKQRGVEARRPGKAADAKTKARTRISTKSGWEKRMENNRRGAIAGSRMRKKVNEEGVKGGGSESEFEGFAD